MRASIRNAVPGDAPRLAEIYRYYVEHTAITFEYVPPSAEEFSARMADTMRRYPYLVAEEDGRVMGYAYAGPFVGRAAYAWSCEMSIYLDHTSRNRALGRALYEAMEARRAAMGILTLYACIGATEHEDEYLTNNSAGFHAHMGYTLAGTFRKCGYKFGRWYDMIWMEKIIGEHLGEQPPVRFGNR